LPSGVQIDPDLLLPIDPDTGFPFDGNNYIDPNTKKSIKFEDLPRDS